MPKVKSSELNESLSLKPSELSTVLKAFYGQRKPKPILLGSPGCGKSSLVYQTFRENMKLPVFVFQATLYDPVELKGLPVYDKEKNISKFIRFEDMPQEKAGILFIDDLPHAPTQTQNAFMRIILEGIAGAWDIGGLFPIAAGNRSIDRAGAKDLQTAMANRFCFLNFQIDYEEWRKWGISHDIAPEILAYLGTPMGREWLDKFDASQQINATPRSWEFASDCFKALKSGSILRTALYGCIGLEAASKLLAWMKYYEKMPDLQKIIAGKNIYPEELDVMYAVVSGLVAIAKSFANTKKTAIFQRLIDYVTEIPDTFVELGALLSNDLCHLDTETFLKLNNDKWSERYPDLLI